MVAAYGYHRNTRLNQSGQKIVQQRYRLCRGHASVIQIPCQYHGLHPLLQGDLIDLLQDMSLVLQHGSLEQPLPNMQIPCVQKLHNTALLSL